MIPMFGMFYQAGRGETANPSLVRLDGGWRLGMQSSVGEKRGRSGIGLCHGMLLIGAVSGLLPCLLCRP